MADEGMHMTLSVGGKINKKRNEKEEEERRRRRNNKNSKEVFPCFLQLFSHGKTPVILHSLLQ